MKITEIEKCDQNEIVAMKITAEIPGKNFFFTRKPIVSQKVLASLFRDSYCWCSFAWKIGLNNTYPTKISNIRKKALIKKYK